MNTESVCILCPVLALWSGTSIYGDCDVGEVHVRAVHDVDGPELRLVDCEVGDLHVGYIPEDKWLNIVRKSGYSVGQGR